MEPSQVSAGSVDRPLTAKERRLAKGVAAGKPVREAALAAGYSKSVAKTKAYKIIKLPRVQSFLTEALERLGVTAEMIVQPIADALKAKRTVAVKGPNDEMRVETEYPDHKIRLEAFDRCDRLYGASLTKQEVPPPPRGNLTVVILRASDLKRAQERAERPAVEINPKKALEVSIVKKLGVPTNGAGNKL